MAVGAVSPQVDGALVDVDPSERCLMTTAPPDHVLIIDDEPLLSTALARRLRARGFQVTTADSGPAGIDALEREPIDVVLLDVMMSEMSGLETLVEIRARWPKSQLPVLMLTSRTESSLVVRCLDGGANDFVPKPPTFPVLVARVRAHLDACRATESVRQSEERYALAARGSRDVLWDWEAHDDRVYLSPGCDTFVPVDRGEAFEGQLSVPMSRVHAADLRRTKDQLQALLLGESDHLHMEIRMRSTEGGGWLWLLVQGLAVRDDSGAITRMAGSISDRSEIGLHDHSTGLPNRRLFLHVLGEALSRGRATGHLPTVLVFSLDRVDKVSSTLGPDGTEEMLRLSTERLLTGLSQVSSWGLQAEVTTLCRVADRQFAVALTGPHSPDEAVGVANALRDRLAESYRLGGLEIRCGATVGIAPPDDVPGAEHSLAHASTAAIRARDRGEGVCTFSAEAHQEAIERMELEADLAVAIAGDELHLVYQPIVDLLTGRPRAVEALCRWKHPTRGPVRPDVFVAISEGAGLASALGEWVLRRACRDAVPWRAADGSPIRVAVNVSPHQVQEPGFVSTVAEALAGSGLDPSRLEVELTEQVFAQDSDQVLASLRELRALGVRTSLDDFGTGYSSLSYLVAFPFDVLKIDRSFVARLPSDPAAVAITRSALAMAHELDLEVVAEGVEESAQATFLASLGCDTAQGWWFDRPQLPEYWDRELVAEPLAMNPVA